MCETLGRALRCDADERIGAREMFEALRTNVSGPEARASLADDVGRARRPATDAVRFSPPAAPRPWTESSAPVDPDATTDHGIPAFDDATEPTLTPQPLPRLTLDTPTALVVTPPSPLATTLRIEDLAGLARPRQRPWQRVLGSVAVVAVGILTVTAGIRGLSHTPPAEWRFPRGFSTTPPAEPPVRRDRFEPAAATPIEAQASSSPAVAPAVVTRLVGATTGALETPSSMAEHRVFVDGMARGAGGVVLRLTCGRHAVRLGSQGRLQWVDVPCGGTVRVDR